MPIQCTDAEWKILEVLWDRSPRTMAEITKTLAPSTGWTRHTVITLLKRMEEKGTVKVDESSPAKTYTPAVTKDEASTDQARKFLSHIFKGDASLLINQLVSSGDLTVEDMQEIIDAMKNSNRK
ncbi:MAG: BlaI/MecI/CopY family transcriptional regulator [Clostridia bacterium]|nr:BlaI/MecI/CopY family transcriptional regulator [Clostridia bacterium]